MGNGTVPRAGQVDDGLGNTCYVLDLGDAGALVVDPSRDLRFVRRPLKVGLRIRFVADTHLHADFLSGAVQLAHDDGARCSPRLPGTGSSGIEVSSTVTRSTLWTGVAAMATPGHTDEHLSFVLSDGSSPLGVFTGGCLIVGSAARTDLLGVDRAEELAPCPVPLGPAPRRVAWRPLRPTHGAGSFCSAPPGADRTDDRPEFATNRLLRAPDSDAFVETLLGSLGSYPPYFRRLGDHRRGPGTRYPESSGSQHNRSAVQRPCPTAQSLSMSGRFPATPPHTSPGRCRSPLRPQFATWLGWLTSSTTR